MKVVGIDLAGVETKKTGFCILDKKLNAKTCILYTDEEITKKVEDVKPKIVAIDAPLALPKGRKSLKEKSNIHLRECDKKLLEMGIKFFPITLGPMRKLTERGIKLRKIFEKKGFKVIETYPGAAQDILKIPRKQKGVKKLKKGLEKLGIKKLNDKMNGDELDAVTCALVGKMYLENNYLAIGDPKEILMILPKSLE
jgi:predicted nuclease with RNAse H fold